MYFLQHVQSAGLDWLQVAMYGLDVLQTLGLAFLTQHHVRTLYKSKATAKPASKPITPKSKRGTG